MCCNNVNGNPKKIHQLHANRARSTDEQTEGKMDTRRRQNETEKEKIMNEREKVRNKEL
jgi:hypothetical protein